MVKLLDYRAHVLLLKKQHSVLFGNPSENKKKLQLWFGQLGLIAVVEKFVSLLYYARPTRLHSGLET